MDAKIFCHTIYCVNPKPGPNSQSGSMSRKGLGIQDPWIISEYNLATVIAIRPLTQPSTFKMGSSLFSAMSRLNLASKTWAYLLGILLTDRTKEKNWLLVIMPTELVFILFIPQIKERFFYPSCRSLNMSPPVWRQWWHQSGYPIGPIWGHHLLFPKRPSIDVPPSLICCSPGGWAVFHVWR